MLFSTKEFLRRRFFAIFLTFLTGKQEVSEKMLGNSSDTRQRKSSGQLGRINPKIIGILRDSRFQMVQSKIDPFWGQFGKSRGAGVFDTALIERKPIISLGYWLSKAYARLKGRSYPLKARMASFWQITDVTKAFFGVKPLVYSPVLCIWSDFLSWSKIDCVTNQPLRSCAKIKTWIEPRWS